MGDASWLGAAGGGGPMAAAAADAKERAERLVGLLPGGGGRPLFVDILQWELGLDQKRKVVVRGQERCAPRVVTYVSRSLPPSSWLIIGAASYATDVLTIEVRSTQLI